MYEIWVLTSVFIEFTNESDSTDEVSGYIHSSPVIQLYKFLSSLLLQRQTNINILYYSIHISKYI